MRETGSADSMHADPPAADVVLVAQTGWGQDADRRRSEEAGFDHHVVKPLDLDQLKHILAAPRAGVRA
jgi:CheY-like chemotaxis protein